MRVLFVHGRGQARKDPSRLKDEWVRSLRSGFELADLTWPAKVEFDFPYYGDVLDDFVRSAKLPAPAEVAEKGPGAEPQFERFMQEVLGEFQRARPELSDAAVAAEMPAEEVGEKGVQNWRWVLAIARLVDRRWGAAAGFTIETFLKDVYLYVNNRHVANGINAIIANQLTDEPTVVVGHSLGSIASYNLVNAAEKAGQHNIMKHVTVGSPLGIAAISSKLGVPQNLAARGWFNAFDPQDIVALNPLDQVHFPTTPPIENHGDVNNDTQNQHGISAYLEDSLTATAIATALNTE